MWIPDPLLYCRLCGYQTLYYIVDPLLYCRLCGYPNVSLHPWKSKSDESQVANREYTNGKLNPRKVTAPHPVCNSNHTHRIQNLRFASHIFNPFAPRGHKLRI